MIRRLSASCFDRKFVTKDIQYHCFKTERIGFHRPTTSTEKAPRTIYGRGCGFPGSALERGPNSAAERYIAKLIPFPVGDATDLIQPVKDEIRIARPLAEVLPPTALTRAILVATTVSSSIHHSTIQ